MRDDELQGDFSGKPLDFGGHGICGSIDRFGRIISLSKYHSEHGWAGFTSTKPFTDQDRYDQAAVRKFRADVAQTAGFGPLFEQSIETQKFALLGGAIPEVTTIFSGGSSVKVSTLTTEYGVIQRWEISENSIDWGGNISVQRAAYSQLTEGGPLKDTEPDVELSWNDNTLGIYDEKLKCFSQVTGFSDAKFTLLKKSDCLQTVSVSSADSDVYFICFSVAETERELARYNKQIGRYLNEEAFQAKLALEIGHWEEILEGTEDDLILLRAIVYAHLLSISTSTEATCILTDHMLLPLSWNRDAWFVAKVLLLRGGNGLEIVRKHINWMFDVADRGVANEWGRCYLVNGDLKDAAYQLDQQVFPLLELADYIELSSDNEMLDRLKPEVDAIVQAILKRRHQNLWLFPTDETPGDDPMEYQYHFSTHVLMVHTFARLDAVYPNSGFRDIADNIQRDTLAHFTANLEGKSVFAYATDAEGNYHFYHDANDVPLAMAVEWGVVEKDDAVWRATLDFAWSPSNIDGYFSGRRLGSVHTPAPWPLGDVQKLIIARLLGDKRDEEAALKDISDAAQLDGGLPEAYELETHKVRSRHWFAWPNALYAIAQLTD